MVVTVNVERPEARQAAVEVVRDFFGADVEEVTVLGNGASGGHAHAPDSDLIAREARAFTRVAADDSQNEPPDFRTPDDDFGS